jgi:hypothetical protein
VHQKCITHGAVSFLPPTRLTKASAALASRLL